MNEIKIDQISINNKNKYKADDGILRYKTGIQLVRKQHEKLGHNSEKYIINSMRPFYVNNMDKKISEISKTFEVYIKNKSRRRNEQVF